MAIGAQVEANDEEPQDGVVAEINITPLTDVFLVLLTICLVALTATSEKAVAREQSLQVIPPRSEVSSPLPQKRAPVLTVTKAGEIYLDHTRIELGAVEAAVGQALAAGHTDTVLIRGDTSAQLGTAVRVMSLARKAGARNINVLTAPGESQ
jgi:biopolymer transport protein ExbD